MTFQGSEAGCQRSEGSNGLAWVLLNRAIVELLNRLN